MRRRGTSHEAKLLVSRVLDLFFLLSPVDNARKGDLKRETKPEGLKVGLWSGQKVMRPEEVAADKSMCAVDCL